MCEQLAQQAAREVRTCDHRAPLGSLRGVLRVGKLSPEEVAARDNITRWFLYFREVFYLREEKPDIRFAEDLGIARSLVSDVVSGKKTASFDVALKMRRHFKRKLDELVFKPPPVEEELPPVVGPTARRHKRSGAA